jgi:hypothetical protein
MKSVRVFTKPSGEDFPTFAATHIEGLIVWPFKRNPDVPAANETAFIRLFGMPL